MVWCFDDEVWSGFDSLALLTDVSARRRRCLDLPSHTRAHTLTYLLLLVHLCCTHTQQNTQTKAVAKKPSKPEGEPEVPVVPKNLAVHKRRPWWAQAARVVVGTAAMAVAGAAGAAAAKHNQVRGAGQAVSRWFG